MAEYAEAERTEEKRIKKENRTNIPDGIKERIEGTSGISLDDVRVHYHSDRPGLFGALAFTQGNQVYMGAGQEKYLPHELGHVVQQKMGMVRATRYENGYAINDDSRLERQADAIGMGSVSFGGSAGKVEGTGEAIQMATATLSEIRTGRRGDMQEPVEVVSGESAGADAAGEYSFTCQPIDAAFHGFYSCSYIKVDQAEWVIGGKIRERDRIVRDYQRKKNRYYNLIKVKDREIENINAIIDGQYKEKDKLIDEKKNEQAKPNRRNYKEINRLNQEIDNIQSEINKNKGVRDGFRKQIRDYHAQIDGIKLQLQALHEEIDYWDELMDSLPYSTVQHNIWERDDKKLFGDVKGAVPEVIHTRNQYHCAEPHVLAKIMPKYQEKRTIFLQGKKEALEQQMEKDKGASPEENAAKQTEQLLEIQAYAERITVVENTSYGNVKEKQALTEFLGRLKFLEVKHDGRAIRPCPVCEQWVKGGPGWSVIKTARF